MWKITQEKHHWMFCRAQNRKKEPNEATSFKCFDRWELYSQKCASIKINFCLFHQAFMRHPDRKHPLTLAPLVPFPPFRQEFLEDAENEHQLTALWISHPLVLEKRSHLSKKPNFFRKIRFIRLKIQEPLPSFLKKILYGPKVWFQTATIGLPNHSHTPLLNYASCQRCCRQFSHFVENKERGEIPNTQLKISFRFYCR